MNITANKNDPQQTYLINFINKNKNANHTSQ